MNANLMNINNKKKGLGTIISYYYCRYCVSFYFMAVNC